MSPEKSTDTLALPWHILRWAQVLYDEGINYERYRDRATKLQNHLSFFLHPENVMAIHFRENLERLRAVDNPVTLMRRFIRK